MIRSFDHTPPRPTHLTISGPTSLLTDCHRKDVFSPPTPDSLFFSSRVCGNVGRAQPSPARGYVIFCPLPLTLTPSQCLLWGKPWPEWRFHPNSLDFVHAPRLTQAKTVLLVPGDLWTYVGRYFRPAFVRERVHNFFFRGLYSFFSSSLCRTTCSVCVLAVPHFFFFYCVKNISIGARFVPYHRRD